ncbi:MAG TPA: hypothetical protein VIW93_11205 [Candidatus Acidoferrum sp.]
MLKVAHWIATRRHNIAQQLIGLRHCAAGAVNKPRLHLAPRLNVASAIVRTERPDVQTLDAIRALIEARFSFSPAVTCLHGAVVFLLTKLAA